MWYACMSCENGIFPNINDDNKCICAYSLIHVWSRNGCWILHWALGINNNTTQT